MLDPLTVSEYSYQLWYLENAERYTQRKISVGDQVEIELHETEPGALPFARGKVLHGELKEIIHVKPPNAGKGAAESAASQKQDDADDAQDQSFTRSSSTASRDLFQTVLSRDLSGWTPPQIGNADHVAACKTVLLDFDQVGVKALDDRTLQVKLKSPTPYFLFLAGYYPLFATNPHCVETYGYPGWTKPDHIVTNGAFKLQSHRVRERIRLVKNDQYWNAANVKLNTIDVLPVESLTTALNLYITGQVDWIPKVPSYDYAGTA